MNQEGIFGDVCEWPIAVGAIQAPSCGAGAPPSLVGRRTLELPGQALSSPILGEGFSDWRMLPRPGCGRGPARELLQRRRSLRRNS